MNNLDIAHSHTSHTSQPFSTRILLVSNIFNIIYLSLLATFFFLSNSSFFCKPDEYLSNVIGVEEPIDLSTVVLLEFIQNDSTKSHRQHKRIILNPLGNLSNNSTIVTSQMIYAPSLFELRGAVRALSNSNNVTLIHSKSEKNHVSVYKVHHLGFDHGISYTVTRIPVLQTGVFLPSTSTIVHAIFKLSNQHGILQTPSATYIPSSANINHTLTKIVHLFQTVAVSSLTVVIIMSVAFILVRVLDRIDTRNVLVEITPSNQDFFSLFSSVFLDTVEILLAIPAILWIFCDFSRSVKIPLPFTFSSLKAYPHISSSSDLISVPSFFDHKFTPLQNYSVLIILFLFTYAAHGEFLYKESFHSFQLRVTVLLILCQIHSYLFPHLYPTLLLVVACLGIISSFLFTFTHIETALAKKDRNRFMQREEMRNQLNPVQLPNDIPPLPPVRPAERRSGTVEREE